VTAVAVAAVVVVVAAAAVGGGVESTAGAVVAVAVAAVVAAGATFDTGTSIGTRGTSVVRALEDLVGEPGGANGAVDEVADYVVGDCERLLPLQLLLLQFHRVEHQRDHAPHTGRQPSRVGQKLPCLSYQHTHVQRFVRPHSKGFSARVAAG